MRFLVKGEWVETGAVLPAEQFAPLIEHVVLPSLEQWDQWEQQGKSRGGVLAGQRAGVFLLEAESAEEVGQLLTSLPFWGYIKWDVIPLQSVRSTIERERGVVAAMRGATQPSGH